ncbi:hypothetical protein DLAC_04336 [Tieghemostelium lacteum]|uniref:EGF-like domain-containing protein n=1 Tax=Tieghemostelium lacteum TaxID=361077 RepID=A0A151ZJ85_TIELA|nr:hypothetical protein DLAC_04336 [Tieghemostelium lacteum]|eukprot:KYQ94061.1 hypothetical protein DLAC_04336 [Tieghemostelium lacteum]
MLDFTSIQNQNNICILGTLPSSSSKIVYLVNDNNSSSISGNNNNIVSSFSSNIENLNLNDKTIYGIANGLGNQCMLLTSTNIVSMIFNSNGSTSIVISTTFVITSKPGPSIFIKYLLNPSMLFFSVYIDEYSLHVFMFDWDNGSGSFSNLRSLTESPIESCQIGFSEVDQQSRLLYFVNSLDGTLWKYSATFGDLISYPVWFANSDMVSRKCGIAYNGTLYMCSQAFNNVWNLEILDTTQQPDTTMTFVNIDNEISSQIFTCLNTVYDNINQQLYFTFSDMNANLGVIGMSKDASESVSEILNNTLIINTALTHSMGIHNQSLFIHLPEVTSGSILSLQYNVTCLNDCSGNGICQSGKCTCNYPKFGKDCSLSLPNIQSTSAGPPPFYGGQVTFSGNGFRNQVQEYLILIHDVPCQNLVYINSVSIECTFEYQSSLTPFQTITVNISSIMYPLITATFPLQHFFATPIVDSITQLEYTIVLHGHNFYPLDYLNVSLGLLSIDNCMELEPLGTSISCPLPTVDQLNSTNLVLSDTKNTIIYNQFYYIQPLLLSYEYADNSPLPITTSSVISIIGKYFKSSITKQLYIRLYNEQYPSLPITEIVSDTLVTVQLPPGIHSYITIVVVDYTDSQTISIHSESNQLKLQYQPPLLNPLYYQPLSILVYEIHGDNFGYDNTLVSISIQPTTSSPKYYPTILNCNQSTLVFQIPGTAQKGKLSLQIDGQSANDTIQFNLQPTIRTVSPLPDITGGKVTILGQFLASTQIRANNSTSNLICTYSQQNYPNSTAFCNGLVPGTGELQFQAVSQLSDQVLISNILTTRYHEPTILNIQPRSYRKTELILFNITGRNFMDRGLSVRVQEEPCTVQSVAFGYLLCTVQSFIDPFTITNPVSIQVTVDNMSGYNNSLLIYEIPCPDPMECSGHGICNFKIGQCACLQNYQGDNCSQKIDSISISTQLLYSKLFLIVIIFLQFLLYINMFIK